MDLEPREGFPNLKMALPSAEPVQGGHRQGNIKNYLCR